MIHRICYQSDEVVVVACGLVFELTRQEVKQAPDLTLARGKQSCPDCGDYDWPIDVIRPYLLRRGKR